MAKGDKSKEPLERRPTITVFCSASEVADKYKDDAEEFSRLLVEHDYDLVWGGSNTGVMKLVAATVQEAGGRIFGITTEMFKHKKRMNADSMEITTTLDERKVKLLERGDAILMMPGGWGSLDEITHTLEPKKHKIHDKPVVVLNTDGFWDGLKMQAERIDRDGFSKRPLDEMIFFASNPEEAIRYINSALSK